jgi:hypothetical protein
MLHFNRIPSQPHRRFYAHLRRRQQARRLITRIRLARTLKTAKLFPAMEESGGGSSRRSPSAIAAESRPLHAANTSRSQADSM